MTVASILYLIALVFFILAALPINTGPLNLGWIGAAFLTAALWFD